MNIRKAEYQDIDQLILLLNEVLEIHAEIRPDVFNSGTTKYSKEELSLMLKDSAINIFVAVEEELVLGYVFVEIKKPKFSSTMKPNTTLYIDDYCVKEEYRHKHIGTSLFNYVKEYAKSVGCYEISLAVWEGNEEAKAFYQKMGFKNKYFMMEYILDK